MWGLRFCFSNKLSDIPMLFATFGIARFWTFLPKYLFSGNYLCQNHYLSSSYHLVPSFLTLFIFHKLLHKHPQKLIFIGTNQRGLLCHKSTKAPQNFICLQIISLGGSVIVFKSICSVVFPLFPYMYNIFQGIFTLFLNGPPPPWYVYLLLNMPFSLL